jgi:hypothetical protein
MDKKIVDIPPSDLHASISDMIAAHQSIYAGIMAHADRHEAMMDNKRRDAAQQRVMDEGAARQNAQIQVSG